MINLRSRFGPGAEEDAVRELARLGAVVISSEVAPSGAHLVQAARAAIDSGVKTLLVGGGDGSISAVANLFVDRADLSLALLPLGTGNEVARELGIPLDLPGACRVVVEGVPTPVDLVQANGRYFLHTALMGPPARANFTVPPDRKRRLGRIAYAFSFLRAVVESRPFNAQVRTSRGNWDGETSVLAVTNNQFNAPSHVLLPASRERSGLSIFIPRDSRRRTLLRVAFGVWGLRQPQPELVFSLLAEEADITTVPRQPLDLDGEFAGYTPAQFRLGRGALRIIAPAMARS